MAETLLTKYKLQRSLPKEEADAFEKILKQANESFVLDWKRSSGVNANGLHYYDFEVYCPTTNFADAYTHLGILWCQNVLPIWNKRHGKKAYIDFNNQKDMFTTAETMQKFNISKRTLQTWRDEGVIEFVQIVDKIYYTQAAIDAMLKKYTVKIRS